MWKLSPFPSRKFDPISRLIGHRRRVDPFILQWDVSIAMEWAGKIGRGGFRLRRGIRGDLDHGDGIVQLDAVLGRKFPGGGDLHF